MHSFVVVVISLLWFGCATNAQKPNSAAAAPSFQTPLGRVVGLSKQFNGKQINVFFGIPYAQPPIDSLRFQPPQPLDQFPSDPFPADRLRPHCPQAPNKKFGDDTNFHEDCLHLNVFVPPTRRNYTSHNELVCPDRPFPIMLYIFGGVGSYNQPIRYHDPHSSTAFNLSYDGEMLAADHDVVTVVVNYRVTMLGNMYLPGQLPGNQALRDQQQAIRFVHRFASHFCGDSQRITLVGNSFGSMSIGMHLLSGRVSHLFRSVIMQSGSPLYRTNMPNTPDRSHRNSLLMADDVGCLRSKSNNRFIRSRDRRLLQRLRRQAQAEVQETRFHPVNLLENSRINRQMRHLVNQLRTNLTLFQVKSQEDSVVRSIATQELESKLTQKMITDLKQTLKFEFERKNRLIHQATTRFKADIDCLLQVPATELGRAGTDLFLLHFLDGDVIPIESILANELRRHISIPDDQIKSMLIGVNDDENCSQLTALSAIKNGTLKHLPSFTTAEMNRVFDDHPIVAQCKQQQYSFFYLKLNI